MPYKDPQKQREYARLWRRKRREEFFKDKECISCGSKDDLTIHHREPKDKIHHNIWSWSEKRRLSEIAKCDILCVDCHKTKHATSCGKYRMYENGCRCKLCKTARRDRQRRTTQRIKMKNN